MTLLMRRGATASRRRPAGGEPLVSPMTVPRVAAPGSFDAPVTISSGGTYTGLTVQATGTANAVTITTTAPVTLVDCWIEHERGHGIRSGATGVDVVIQNSVVKANHPGAAGTNKGYHTFVENGAGFVAEHCWFEGGGGLWNLTMQSGATHHVRWCQFRNMDGRHSDGAGGYVTNTGTAITDWSIVTAIQLPSCPLLDAELAWNEIVNLPGESGVQDCINVYESNGSQSNPIDIHHNCVWGAYPAHPENDYFGGGILVGDSDDDGGTEHNGLVRWSVGRDNRVAGTTNYGVGCAQGQEMQILRNTIVASGTDESGTDYYAANVGVYAWNAVYAGHPLATDTFGPCAVEDNVSRFWRPADTKFTAGGAGARSDYYLPDATTDVNNSSGAAGRPTWAEELALWDDWWNTERVAAGLTIGPT